MNILIKVVRIDRNDNGEEWLTVKTVIFCFQFRYVRISAHSLEIVSQRSVLPMSCENVFKIVYSTLCSGSPCDDSAK